MKSNFLYTQLLNNGQFFEDFKAVTLNCFRIHLPIMSEIISFKNWSMFLYLSCKLVSQSGQKWGWTEHRCVFFDDVSHVYLSHIYTLAMTSCSQEHSMISFHPFFSLIYSLYSGFIHEKVYDRLNVGKKYFIFFSSFCSYNVASSVTSHYSRSIGIVMWHLR